MSNTDYSVIIFCGHGYALKNSDTIIELSQGNDFNAMELRNSQKRRLVILDCCRVIHEGLEARMTEGSVMYELSDSQHMRARMFYESEVQKCAITSLVVAHGCNLNETAGDDENRGGYYSYSLLESANIWARQSTSPSVYSIASAHQSATEKVEVLSGGKQHPTIEKPRTIPYFPFAIKI